jgi:hypothetical protein
LRYYPRARRALSRVPCLALDVARSLSTASQRAITIAIYIAILQVVYGKENNMSKHWPDTKENEWQFRIRTKPDKRWKSWFQHFDNFQYDEGDELSYERTHGGGSIAPTNLSGGIAGPVSALTDEAIEKIVSHVRKHLECMMHQVREMQRENGEGDE